MSAERERALEILVANVVSAARAAGFARGRRVDDSADNEAEDKAVTELLAALRSSEPQGWQPIETAPKDGTKDEQVCQGCVGLDDRVAMSCARCHGTRVVFRPTISKHNSRGAGQEEKDEPERIKVFAHLSQEVLDFGAGGQP